uniref:Uncharacterized protein n=1 Tax=Salix viminalis TaxID=40686 RepID=A0A6N2NDL8_SALVM
MAGELQEPLSWIGQVDSLHSGSISLGRFESEDLSWERRSSFSQNRRKLILKPISRKSSCLRPDSLDGLSGRGSMPELRR